MSNHSDHLPLREPDLWRETAAACERVLQFHRVQFARWSAEGWIAPPDEWHIYAITDYGTHWLIKTEIPYVNDPSCDALMMTVAAERGTEALFWPPTRTRNRVNAADLTSIRYGWITDTPVTPDDPVQEEIDRLWRQGSD